MSEVEYCHLWEIVEDCSKSSVVVDDLGPDLLYGSLRSPSAPRPCSPSLLITDELSDPIRRLEAQIASINEDWKSRSRMSEYDYEETYIPTAAELDEALGSAVNCKY